MTNSEAVILLMSSEYYKQGYKQGASDVLDKIRTEIEILPTSKSTETHCIYIKAADFKEKVLAIFDKYIESRE